MLIYSKTSVDAAFNVAKKQRTDHVALLAPDANPLVRLVAQVKEATALDDVADLLVRVEVLLEKHLDLRFICINCRNTD